MHRLLLLILASFPLVACQASVSEDFVDTKPSPTQEDKEDITVRAAEKHVVYTGTADLKALTSTNWIVSEGGGANPCHVRFSSNPHTQTEAVDAISNGIPKGQASTSGCANEELSKVTAWAVNGDTIELQTEDKTPTAYLLMERPDLLLGYTAQGYDLVVSQ